jgi:hypothetical protein
MPWRWGEWRYSSTILDLSTRWRWVVSFMPWPLYPREIAPGTYRIGGWVGSRIKRKICCPCQEWNSCCPACSLSLYWLSYPGSYDCNFRRNKRIHCLFGKHEHQRKATVASYWFTGNHSILLCFVIYFQETVCNLSRVSPFTRYFYQSWRIQLQPLCQNPTVDRPCK